MFRGQGDEEETEGGREQPEREGRKPKTVSGKAKEERRRERFTVLDHAERSGKSRRELIHWT